MNAGPSSMARFHAGEGDSHSWNNQLAHDVYEDNVETHGRETARQLLRQDIRSWVRERYTDKPFEWTLHVRDGDVTVGDNDQSLVKMVEINPISGPNAGVVAKDIKENVPVEAATIRIAVERAVAGDKVIAFPEQHGEKVRYFTVWEQDQEDPNTYHGKRVDLGANIEVNEAHKKVIQKFTPQKEIHVSQDEQHHGAFVLWSRSAEQTETVRHSIVEAVSEGAPREIKKVIAISERLVEEQHQRQQTGEPARDVYLSPMPKEEHEQIHTRPVYVKGERVMHDPVREVTDTIVSVGSRIAVETRETAVSLGAYALREVASRRHTTVVARIRMLFRKSEATRVRHREPITVARIREKPANIFEVINKQHTEMRRTARALSVVAETRVAIGAVPFLIGTLAKEQPPSVKSVEKSLRRHKEKKLRNANGELQMKKRAVEKSIRRHKQKELPVKAERRQVKKEARPEKEKKYIKSLEKKQDKELQMLRLVKRGLRINLLERSSSITKEKRKKLKRMDRPHVRQLRLKNERMKKFEPRVKKLEVRKKRQRRSPELRSKNRLLRSATREQRINITPEKKKQIHAIEKPISKREQRARRRKLAVQQLSKQAPAQRFAIGKKELSQKIIHRGIKTGGRESARKETKLKEKETVLGLSFAWMFFLLLRLNDSEEKSIPKHFDVSIHQSVVHKDQRESTPWVLLTIIYYLAMIREGGSPKPTNTKKKKKKTKKIEVVLYTYGS